MDSHKLELVLSDFLNELLFSDHIDDNVYQRLKDSEYDLRQILESVLQRNQLKLKDADA